MKWLNLIIGTLQAARYTDFVIGIKLLNMKIMDIVLQENQHQGQDLI